MVVSSDDKELFKDRIEVSLEGRQLFFLFLACAAFATLIFVVGVVVGREFESRAVVSASPPHDPLAVLDRTNDGLTFPAVLRDDTSAASRYLSLRTWIAKTKVCLSGELPAEKLAVPDRSLAAAPEEQQSASGSTAPGRVKSRPRFRLQVGAFQEKSEADEFFRTLEKDDYVPYMVAVEIPGKGRFYRVYLGSYQTYREAMDAKNSFEIAKQVVAYVRPVKLAK